MHFSARLPRSDAPAYEEVVACLNHNLVLTSNMTADVPLEVRFSSSKQIINVLSFLGAHRVVIWGNGAMDTRFWFNIEGSSYHAVNL
jgi:hypothetical protein